MITLAGKEFRKGELFLIAGPCLIESEEIVLRTADCLVSLCARLGFPLIFKGSYRKANRLSAASFRGIGDEKALTILAKVKTQFDCPVLTDVHETREVLAAAQVCDVLQIPAFLCRQTDLLQSAARAAAAINIKKGQFLAAEDMQYLAEKAVEAGNKNVILTERGTSFGYRDLVVDFRSLVTMKETGHLVVFRRHTLSAATRRVRRFFGRRTEIRSPSDPCGYCRRD